MCVSFRPISVMNIFFLSCSFTLEYITTDRPLSSLFRLMNRTPYKN